MIKHIPVLVYEILENIPDKVESIFDGTIWHWWHFQKFLENLGANKSNTFVGIDKDPNILEKTEKLFSEYYSNVFFSNTSYAKIQKIQKDLKIKWFDIILIDLGVNLEHFKKADRGFSIKEDAQLDMRFDNTKGETAKDVLNKRSKKALQEIFIKYWDFGEKFSWKIAEEIVVNRKKIKIDSTQKLKNLCKDKLNLGQQKIAVIFQCLRIEVNKELEELEKFLEKFPKTLKKWWRCFIISYHSIEDRLVKNKFKELTKTNKFKLVNKKVIIPKEKEKQKNKAARSAKLRIIQAL